MADMVLNTLFTGKIDDLKDKIEELQRIFSQINKSVNESTTASKAATAASNAHAAASRAETAELKAKKAAIDLASAAQRKSILNLKEDNAKALAAAKAVSAEEKKNATEYSKVLKSKSNETERYKQALERLSAVYGRQGTALKLVVKDLDAVEQSLRRNADAQLRNGKITKQQHDMIISSTNRYNKVLELRAATTGKTIKQTEALTIATAKLQKQWGAGTSQFAAAKKEMEKFEAGIMKTARAAVLSGNLSKEGFDKLTKSGNLAAIQQNMLERSARKTSTEIAKQKTVVQDTGSAFSQLYMRMKTLDEVPAKISPIVAGFDRLKSSMKSMVAYSVSGAIIYKFVDALRSGTQAIIDFDQSLKNLQAITSATDAEVAVMGETIKDVARSTKFNTTEIADGMTLIGQAGFNAVETIQAIKGVADLATGTLSTMAETTDLVTTTLRSFQMDASETTKVVDVMANAVNKSKLTIGKLNTVFNYVGAAAHQAGITLDELAAATMVLADRGMRASTIGTGLRQVIARLIAPSRSLREEFAAQKIELSELDIETVGFSKALGNLSKVLVDQKTGMVDVGKAFALFGLRAAQTAAILAGTFDTSFKKALATVGAFGTAQEMAAKQAEGLGIKIKNLMDRLKLVAVAVGNAGATGALTGFVDVLRGLALALEKLANNTFVQFVVQVAAASAAIYGLAKAFLFLKAVNIAGMFSSLAAIIGNTALNLVGLGATGSAALGTIAGIGGAAATAIAPLVLLAATIGVVGVALYKLATLKQKQIEQAGQLVVKLNEEEAAISTAQKSLKRYSGEIKENSSLSYEYQKYVSALFKEHKELYLMVDRNTVSYEDLQEALKKIKQQKFEKSLEQQKIVLSALVERLKAAKKAKDALLAGGQGLSIEGAFQGSGQAPDPKELEAANMRIAQTTDTARVAAEAYIQKLAEKVIAEKMSVIGAKLNVQTTEEVIDAFGGAAEATKHLTDKVKELTQLKDLQEFTDSFGGESIENIEKIEKALESLSHEEAKLFYQKMQQNKEWEARTKKTMEEQGRSPEQIKTIINKEKQLIMDKYLFLERTSKQTLANNLQVYKDGADNELMLLDDKLQKGLIKESEYETKKANIRLEVADANVKLQEEYLASLDNEINSVEDIKAAEDNLHQARMEYGAATIALNKAKAQAAKEAIEQESNDSINALNQKRFQDEQYLKEKRGRGLISAEELSEGMLKIENDYNAARLQLATETHNKIEKVINDSEALKTLRNNLLTEYQKFASSLADSITEYTNKIEEANDRLLNRITSINDKILGLQRSVMTEEQKQASLKEEALGKQKALEEGLAKFKQTNSQKDLQNLQNLSQAAESAWAAYGGSSKEAVNEAIEGLEKVKDVLEDANNTEVKIFTNLREQAIAALNDVNQKIDEILRDKPIDIKLTMNKEELDKEYEKVRADFLSKNKHLETKMVADASQSFTTINKLQKAWDKLQDKTITITTVYKTIGTKPSSGSGNPPPKKYATGGVLPGYGGGDRISASLEAGEAVVRKEAVNAIGPSFFNWLNNLKNVTDIKNTVPAMLASMKQSGNKEAAESMVIRFEAGNAVLPITTSGNSFSMRKQVKQFNEELVRMKLARA